MWDLASSTGTSDPASVAFPESKPEVNWKLDSRLCPKGQLSNHFRRHFHARILDTHFHPHFRASLNTRNQKVPEGFRKGCRK